MRILLSNDDGVLAPGLAALAQALKNIAEVTVVAPESERSGFSSALTLDRPLRPLRLSNGFWSVNGTPADCVYLAVNGFFDQEPDMVISGINSGANLGDDVLYSGTVGAALEGRFLGKPSLAVSLCGASVKQYTEIEHYNTAANMVCELVQHWKELQLPVHNIINMNVPDLPQDEIRGFRLTRLGKRERGFSVSTVEDPRGRKAYWIGLAGNPNRNEPGTDFHAIDQGYVSLTPLQTDLTSHDALPALTEWLDRQQGK
ncbi:5'-nucleotidase /3'-nucleotidase /exopolyphosphatase [Fluviicoccus keumensis]|uniref:5'-nucleotidase SurE n=1 Tax=Fluviicoccus keumensis TaxID=1435465 RepID=A0A4Q7Z4H6_9GAMM|nr:5'/3'-nucleotidase SurE [Fluviicoccus keumensis]RZU45250.1 5'-nucleotidase /3'-nucleotidase /exopolyphosphatase [Fluviicoccus keumensis]